jgi:hypothetical protein
MMGHITTVTDKPKWETAPDWANFLAMDSNGDWAWFEVEPFISNWKEVEGTKWEPEIDVYGDGMDWKQSLEKRTR